MAMPAEVRIVEVGPRDGLQNERVDIGTAAKVELVDRLSRTGLRSIEATAFVSPKWVPQMADAAEVLAGIERMAGIAYPVLVPNEQGYARAREAGADEVAVFTAASEAFNLRNTNASIAQSLERFAPVLERARADGVRVRGYVSTVLGCPYQGEVPLADVGTPAKARAMLQAVASEVPMAALAIHFHDTYGQALANVLACLEDGVAVVDSAVSGAGGCPYAKGASGNVASEDVVYMLHGLGIRTGVDLPLLAETGRWLAGLLGRETGSKVGRALAA